MFNIRLLYLCQYIACVTNKVKFNSRPWSSIRKLKESSIVKRMEAFIDISNVVPFSKTKGK